MSTLGNVMEIDAVDHKQLDVVLAPLIVEENTEDSDDNLEEDELIERINQLRERKRMLIDRQVQEGQQVIRENPGNINNKGNAQETSKMENTETYKKMMQAIMTTWWKKTQQIMKTNPLRTQVKL